MNKKPTAWGLITLVLGLATFLWLLFLIYEIRADLPGMLRFEASNPSDYLIGAGYLAMLLFHAAALVFLFAQARSVKRFAGWPVLGLVLGTLSLFAIAAEKVMYDEIGRELAIEFPVPGEVSLLYACLGVNLTVPGMAALALVPGPLELYWFPYYLFLVLTLFSAGTLFFFKRG